MIRNIEDWPRSNYLAFIGDAKAQEWLTPDWVLSQFGESRALARENYKRFVLDGAGPKLCVWSYLNCQIFLGNKEFVSKMQGKVENSVRNWSIPKRQKRPVAMSLLQIEEQH